MLIEWSDNTPISAVRDWINAEKEIHYLKTQAEIIKSRPLVEKLVKQFKELSQVPGRAPSSIEKSIKRLQKRIDVSVEAQTNLIKIRVLDENPRLAAQVANALAESYQEFIFERQRDEAGRGTQFLMSQEKEALDRLQQAETTLKEFKIGKNIVSYDSEVRLILEEIKDLETMKTTRFPDSTDKDPRLSAVNVALKRRKEKLRDLMADSAHLLKLERDVRMEGEIHRDIRNKFQERYLVEGLGKTRISDVRRQELIVPATPPLNPSSPKTILNIILAVVIGLGGGIGLSFFVDSVQPALWDEAQIEETLGLSVIATIPHLTFSGSPSFKGGYEEPFGLLAQKIDFLIRTPSSQCWMVAGSGPREGRSASLFHLSKALAGLKKKRKIVLIDTDLRNPGMGALSLGLKKTGLAEVIRKKVSLKEAVHATDIDNLFVMPAGEDRVSYGEGGGGIGSVLAELRSMFDVLLLDSPPLGPYGDALALAREADRILFVVSCGRTREGSARRALEHLKLVGAEKIVGILLNRKPRPVPEIFYRAI
ncbi:MAG: hypothetical protein IPN19_05495 [Elusimicrobia bacterium]|nr:hypothetical protein [Elusimicrobiota bacterium]